jgi:hypothetical protein
MTLLFAEPLRRYPNRSGAPLQTNVLDRTKSESTPDQKRTEPGSKVEKSSQPIANPLTQNPENQKQGEPTEPTASPSCAIDRIT